jgi:hypothetical protein
MVCVPQAIKNPTAIRAVGLLSSAWLAKLSVHRLPSWSIFFLTSFPEDDPYRIPYFAKKESQIIPLFL